MPSRISGTSPLTILPASPSATAVLPTPGSPSNTGLFFVLLARIWITRSISFSLPTTGSNLCSCAAAVKSVPNSSKLGVFVFPEEALAVVAACVGFVSPSIFITLLRTLFRSTPKFSSTLAATPSPSRISPRSKCSVPI